MIKRYLVTCTANMCAEKELKVIVKASSERNAKSKAVNKCYDEGYFYVSVVSCRELGEEMEKAHELV